MSSFVWSKLREKIPTGTMFPDMKRRKNLPAAEICRSSATSQNVQGDILIFQSNGLTINGYLEAKKSVSSRQVRITRLECFSIETVDLIVKQHPVIMLS